MKEINKQFNQLSGHFGIIAIPLCNIKLIQSNTIEYFNPDMNYQLNCARESINYSSTTNPSKSGVSIDHKISATVTGRSIQNDLLLVEMLRFQFVVILQNADGNYTKVGAHANGLDFSFEYTTSEDACGFNGYKIEFSGKTLCN